MPASPAGYQYPALQKLYPATCSKLFQQSVNAAGTALGDAVLE